MTQTYPSSRRPRRSFPLALFVTAMAWFVLSDALAGRAARGITVRFDMEPARPLLSALFLIFLLTIGFNFLQMLSRGATSLRELVGLPQRKTSGREWSLGVAIGWSIAAGVVLVMALAGALRVELWFAPRAWMLFGWNLAALVAGSLAMEIALRGYPFRQLIAGLGPTWATVVLALLLGFVHGTSPYSTWISVLVTMLSCVLLSMAWLRTHGLWLGWGIRFGWGASVALLFGLPLRGDDSLGTLVATRAVGPAWLTGADLGPDAAILTAFGLLVAMIVLVRSTSDYAWEYTRPPIVAAGYEVNVPPPAAHTAMEQGAPSSPPSLVQIHPASPSPPPPPPPPRPEEQ